MLEKQFSGRFQGMNTFTQRVVVPDYVKHKVPDGTVLPATMKDSRRFARRSCDLTAHLEILTGWMLDDESERLFEVPVTNISRSGACFFHHVQLFPDDQLILNFGKLDRKFQVARCRRVADKCFEIGVHVMASDTSVDRTP